MAYILIAHSTIIFGSAMVSVLYFFAHFDGILECYSEHGATTPGAARREFLPMVLYLLALPASVIFLAHGLLGGVINACGVDAAISAELSRQSDRGSGRTPRYTVERSQRRYELNTRAGILLKWGDRLLAFGLACAFISFVQCVLPRNSAPRNSLAEFWRKRIRRARLCALPSDAAGAHPPRYLVLGFFILGNGRVTLLWELTTAADNETAALIIVNVNTSAIEGIEHYDECIDRASEMFTVMSAGAIATGFLCLLLLPVAATALKASAALCRRVDASNTRHALASIIREERQAASEVSCSSSDPRRCSLSHCDLLASAAAVASKAGAASMRAPTPPPEESEVSASAVSSGFAPGGGSLPGSRSSTLGPEGSTVPPLRSDPPAASEKSLFGSGGGSRQSTRSSQSSGRSSLVAAPEAAFVAVQARLKCASSLLDCRERYTSDPSMLQEASYEGQAEVVTAGLQSLVTPSLTFASRQSVEKPARWADLSLDQSALATAAEDDSCVSTEPSYTPRRMSGEL